MKKHNLHTHTTFSDGVLKPEMLLKKAYGAGLEILGISDHAFSEKLGNDRQITNCIDKYLDQLIEIKKNENDIELKVGIEIDISRNYGTLPSNLPFKKLSRFDYILFEYVDTEYEKWGRVNGSNISEIVEIRKKLPIPVGIAHNDMQKNYNGEEEKIAEILGVNDIFVELNHSENLPNSNIGRNTRFGNNYYMHFSKKLINYLKEHDVAFVAGTDSHYGNNLADLNSVSEFVEKNNLRYHEIVM